MDGRPEMKTCLPVPVFFFFTPLPLLPDPKCRMGDPEEGTTSDRSTCPLLHRWEGGEDGCRCRSFAELRDGGIPHMGAS